MGNTELNIVEQYKYLGIILNEFLDYDVTAQVLSDAANRALVSVINTNQLMVWGTIHTQDYFRVVYAQYWTMAVKYGDINHSIK